MENDRRIADLETRAGKLELENRELRRAVRMLEIHCDRTTAQLVDALNGWAWPILPTVGIVPDEGFSYGELHQTCPHCANDSLEQTCMGISQPPDYNRASCSCGWSGIVHDLLP